MRSSYLCSARTCRWLAAALAFCWAPHVPAEEVASLASAIYFQEGNLWSDAGFEPASVELAAGQLTPVPMHLEGGSSISATSEGCQECNGNSGDPFRDQFPGAGGWYNRCGCDQKLFPWIAGPGNCDTWCVGPHWNVEVDGMFIRRDDAEWEDVAGVDPAEADQFDYGPGARLFLTGYNYSNYGLQIGYEGVNDFHALAATATDDITIESRINSLEVDVLRRTETPLKLFAGFRYVQLDEDYVSVVRASGDGDRFKVSNRMPGFQIGALRDAWQLNRWITLEPYGNVGGYLNDYKREVTDITGGVYTAQKHEFTEMAFIGEAGVTSVLRINPCLALRGGYQIVAIDGVGTALDAAVDAANLTPTFDRQTLIYHGARFGLEYQR